jgi:pectinesterase
MKLVVLILLAVSTVAAGDATTLPSDKTVVTVAADGSGDFKTVQAAIDAVPASSDHRITIHVLPGTYKERLTFPKNEPMITLLGDDATRTILTFDNTHNTLGENGKPLGTSKSASTFVYGNDFLAQNITFENSAGPVGQALAINIYGDRGIFDKCRFLGWQDTVMTNQNRQYFQDCYIAGHVDFIFGASTVYFKNCEIHCRAGGSITAASTPKESAYGYIFDHCTITSEAPAGSVVLGRPWRPYGATIFMYCILPDSIRAGGWDDWGKSATARYAEYHNSGPGAAVDKRVQWARQLTDEEAQKITVETVLGGKDNWNPQLQIKQLALLPGN